MFTFIPFIFNLIFSIGEKGPFFKVLSWILVALFGAAVLFLFRWLLGLFLSETLSRIISDVLLVFILIYAFSVYSNIRHSD